MHLTMLALFAMAALVATAQPHARRDPTDLGYFSCDTAADTAVCSELADSTEASLETASETINLEGLAVYSCEPYMKKPTKPLCCRKYIKTSSGLPYANSGEGCTNGNLLTGVGTIISKTG